MFVYTQIFPDIFGKNNVKKIAKYFLLLLDRSKQIYMYKDILIHYKCTNGTYIHIWVHMGTYKFINAC